ncbi:hypothetical protein ASJ36_15690 [Aeromonas sp. ARM81]|nr:hypothetical protein ASJ36_15690 [Aeromonas sp. ARM81]
MTKLELAYQQLLGDVGLQSTGVGSWYQGMSSHPTLRQGQARALFPEERAGDATCTPRDVAGHQVARINHRAYLPARTSTAQSAVLAR